MKRALVTGASRGIGKATAIAFARRGLSVALVGRPSPALDATREEVSALGVTAWVLPCDVAVTEEVSRALGPFLDREGAPDVVVNNAGIVRRGTSIEDTPVDAWDEVVAVNLRGPFLVTRALLPSMKARGSGRFIHVASISGAIGCPQNASYAASKWGVLGFAKSLAEELRGTGLVSASILPGSVDTDMLAGSGFPPAMTAEDVAGTIVYLALDAPSAIHGSAVEMFG